MGYAIFRTNPFEVFSRQETERVREVCSIREWLGKRLPGFVEFDRPTICFFNGHPLLRKRWENTRIGESDIVIFATVPGWTIIPYIIYALILVAAVVMANNVKPQLPNAANTTPEGDPVFTLRGQRNQIKLGDPIEVPYGKNKIFPSYAAAPYNQYINNDQYLYVLLCLGQGEYDVAGTFIEDTPLSNFQDITHNFIPPGGTTSLFPDNVVTSQEIGSIELFGPNEPESGATWVIDVPFDDNGTPEDTSDDTQEEGHWEYAPIGPYVLNEPGTTCNRIEVDVTFPKGNYGQSGNSIVSRTGSVRFEVQEIDDDGEAVGGWVEIVGSVNGTWTGASPTQKRYTIGSAVTAGRYQIRGYRYNEKDTNATSGNTIVWESARAFLPSTRTFGAVTLWEIRAKATNNLNDSAQNRFAVVATRKLPLWNTVTQTFSPVTATRGIIPAFMDIFRAKYGANLANQFLDLDSLAELHEIYEAREEYFDWVFDQKQSVWDAAKLIARCGRATPMLMGSQITLIREEPKTIPEFIFNQENIVAGSFRIETRLTTLDEYDGLIVEYMNQSTWKMESVLCKLEDETGEVPETLKLSGVANRRQAYKLGMFFRRQKRFRRQNIVFRTGLEGSIPFFGDPIAIAHDMVKTMSGGYVKSISGTTLRLSEPVNFLPGDSYKIALRDRLGVASIPVTCTPGADLFTVTTASAFDSALYPIDEFSEPPFFNFGKAANWSKFCVLTNIAPAGGEQVELTAVPYDARLFLEDDVTEPPGGDNGGNNPPTPSAPDAPEALVVSTSPGVPNEVVAAWAAVQGARYYVVQLSYDGVLYEPMGSAVSTFFKLSVLPKVIWVRVAAVGTGGAGEWSDVWTGQAPVAGTNIVIDDRLDPNPITSFSIAEGIGFIVLSWVLPTNTPTDEVYIYENTTAAIPANPTYVLGASTRFFREGMDGTTTRYFWAKVKGRNGRFSAVAGPVNGEGLDYPDIGDIEDGLTALEGTVAILASDLVGLSSDVSAEVAARAAADADLGAEYVLSTITTGGGVRRVAGFRVTNYGGAGGSSEFVVQADKFGFVNTSGAGLRVPFIIESGVVYLDEAVIRNAAITQAMIANAAIGTAQIQDLNVSTLKIQNQAVTIPISAYTDGGVTTHDVGWIEIQSATIISTGAPINVTFGFVPTGSSWKQTGTTVPTSPSAPPYEYRIRCDGSDIFTGQLNYAITPFVVSPDSYYHYQYFYNALFYGVSHTPGSGSHTYTIEVRLTTDSSDGSSATATSATKRTILLLETKK